MMEVHEDRPQFTGVAGRVARGATANSVVRALLAMALLACVHHAAAADEPLIEAAIVSVGNAEEDEAPASPTACFSAGFLTSVARETDIPVKRELTPVTLDDEALFDHPFLILTGRGAWQFTDDQQAALRDFIDAGGFVLASARCGDEAWSRSLRATIAALHVAAGDDDGEDEPALAPLDMDHAIFSTLYEIDQVRLLDDDTPRALEGLERGGRLAVLFSPQGLNDGRNVSTACRCCDGSEIRNAQAINANALVYALTH
ncbi:MAG: DUF4159 domain-containing protein [Phycisphaeraceae bacterium]